MATDKAKKMIEALTAQSFGVIELAAHEGRRNPEQRVNAITTIQGQLRVLAEIGAAPKEEQLSL